MGYSYLISVQADSVDDLEPNSAAWDNSRDPLGHAILRLTRDVGYYAGTGPKRRTSHDFRSHDGAVRFCGEVHYHDDAVFVWSEGSLMRLSEASDDMLTIARAAIEEELTRRSHRPAV